MPEIISLSQAQFIYADGATHQIFNFGATDTRIVVNGNWYDQADCTLADGGQTIVVKPKAEAE